MVNKTVAGSASRDIELQGPRDKRRAYMSSTAMSRGEWVCHRDLQSDRDVAWGRSYCRWRKDRQLRNLRMRKRHRATGHYARVVDTPSSFRMSPQSWWRWAAGCVVGDMWFHRNPKIIYTNTNEDRDEEAKEQRMLGRNRSQLRM